MYAGVAWYRGRADAAFLAAQPLLAFLLLETINCIEHYGLERRQLPPGRYERVAVSHSWNSSHRVTNWLLINLARHSDHHLTSSMRCQVLDHVDEAPQLPAGYGTMFIAAWLPLLWFRLMDPRVEEWRRRHVQTEGRG